MATFFVEITLANAAVTPDGLPDFSSAALVEGGDVERTLSDILDSVRKGNMSGSIVDINGVPVAKFGLT
jgi:hypothetical protein